MFILTLMLVTPPKRKNYYSHFTDDKAEARRDEMSYPKGATKWQKLTPKLVLLLNLFTQLSEQEAKQQDAGKEGMTPKLLFGESCHYRGNFPPSRAANQGSVGLPQRLSYENQHPGLMRRSWLAKSIAQYFFVF